MNKIIPVLWLSGLVLASCIGSRNGAPGAKGKDSGMMQNDTVRIANEELEYEIIIIDPGFNGWFNSYAKPRNYYAQSYLESRNRIWVNEWNLRASQPTLYNPGLFEMRIDYNPNTDYGYEVNYMLFNYLTYFQLTNKIRLGGFDVRI
jgi:hypothetical protein